AASLSRTSRLGRVCGAGVMQWLLTWKYYPDARTFHRVLPSRAVSPIVIGILFRRLAVLFQHLRQLPPGIGRLDALQLYVEMPVVAEVVQQVHRLPRRQRQFADQHLVSEWPLFGVRVCDRICPAKLVPVRELVKVVGAEFHRVKDASDQFI